MHVDVIVIGSGQAGVPLAVRLAAAGRRVVLAERGPLGGTCINTGCTPTKTMVASARAAHVARNAARLGIHTDAVRVDLAGVVARKDAIVNQWRESVASRLNEAGEGLTLVRGHARFTGDRTVDVNGSRYSADHVVINSGARGRVPRLAGLDMVTWLDNASIMELREPPRHLVVLGGGYIGCEFGQMFRRFGSNVTILERGAHLLSREDDDVAEAVEGVFRNEGVRIVHGAVATAVERSANGIAVRLEDGSAIDGSHLLVAVGRIPNTDGLECATAGIDLDERGWIRVDDHYRASAPGVFAVGDVTGGPQFTHVSWDDYRILFDILNGRDRTAAGRHVPFTVFTDPQVARVGLSEREAGELGVSCEIGRYPFSRIARAIEIDERAGLIKVLIDPRDERILGAAIVGAEAGELIHIFVTLMQAGAGARAIVDAEMVHPTFAEGVQSAVMSIPRFALA